MSQNKSDKVTFQITVTHLTLSQPLSKGDTRVTIKIGDMSKITCSGALSEDGLTITWNHSFLFTVIPSTPVGISIWTLPKELSFEWNKQPLGNQMNTSVTNLLESRNGWQCGVLGPSDRSITLFMTCQDSDALIVSNGHDCVSSLKEYATDLYEHGEQFNNMPIMSTVIELKLAMLDLSPLGHPDHSIILCDLAKAFESCYFQGGNISDLNKAIEIKQTRLNLCPLGHSEHVDAFGELAISLWKFYCIQKNQADLNRLIEMQHTWLNICPPGHPDHPKALGEFALSLWNRYLTQGSISDLDKSIEMGEKRLNLCPQGYSSHATALNNLALSMNSRYRRFHHLTDLERAIELQEKCLELRPLGHQKHGLALRNLALSLLDLYDELKNHSDLARAIKLFREALAIYPPHHKDFAFNASNLAGSILLSYEVSCKDYPSDKPPSHLDDAFDIYRSLKTCGPAASLDLLDATQNWVRDAEKHGHTSVLEAYQTALHTLDHFTSLNSSLDSKHETMQAMVADLANDAFSCAIWYGNLQAAVELLEQGRGILWNQLARFDIPMATLESQGDEEHKLGVKFTQLSTKLRQHAQGNSEQAMDPYWRVQEEWRSVVEEIRCLDGFSRFLLPPRFEDLQQAAESGPVIIVNASEYGCDALIVLHNRPPVHVKLPCSFADVVQLCLQLLELTEDPHAYGEHREFWVKQLLRELWSSVAEPIITVLQDNARLAPGSRIWWCPTSKFTMLPFHAAGPHRGVGKNLMDIYISSYAPSLSALIRARERVRSQKEAGGLTNVTSFAVVGQGKPSADTKLGELPEVAHEIWKIRNETDMPADVQFETITGSGATIEGAVRAFRDHRWVHVACHGAQHAEKPFESWFAMGDGKLTLMRILQERYTKSEFAFLSACHTAVGDASTPDEVLHLAAGMQFAGFNGVIGTLWRVDDSEAHQMVTRFYKEMFKQPVIGFEHAATALNTAVIESANDIALEKRIVFVHIGT